MNKDMINIDDFVREKLGAHSEEQDPAAWLRMKALLDKEMPEKLIPVGFRYGKQLAVLSVVLLLGVLCVGSYQQLTSVRQTSQVSSEVKQGAQALIAKRATRAVQPVHVEKNPTNLTRNVSSKGKTNLLVSKKDQIKADAKPNIAQSAALIQPAKAERNTANAIAKTTTNAVGHIVAKGKLKSNIAIAHNRQADAQGLNAVGNIAKVDAVSALTTSRPKGSLNGITQQPKEIAVRNAQQKTAIIPIANHKTDIEKNAASAKSSSKQSIAIPSSNAQAQNANESNSVRMGEMQSDTMLATTIVTKEFTSKGFPRKVVHVIDTIAKDKIVVGNNNSAAHTALADQKSALPLPPKQKKNRSGKNEAIPVAAVTAQVSNHNAQVNSQPKQVATAQKHTRTSLLQQLNLPEAIANAKSDMRHAQFYWGFNGGLNYTYSSSINFKGIQFGPTGELVFNKHWSLFGAINYFNRSGSKKTVNDNYAAEKTTVMADSILGSNYYFTVQSDSTNRYFNFSTVHSFEMPLAVRYAFKKLYVLGGINLAYYLRVNVEEVNKSYNNVNPHVLVVNTSKPILNTTQPMLNSADFGARFGVGYLFGLGYQINPSWQADVRMSSLFWDNAKGTGAQTLSNAFYRLPSVQISLGYQFNRSGLRPSFGPTP